MRHAALLVLLLSALHAAEPAQHMVLEGPWKMHFGDDLRWASPDFDDKNWEDGAGLPRSPSGGFQWYRTSVTIPAAWQDQPLALGIGPMEEAFDVYVNGINVVGRGPLDPVPVSRFERHLSVEIPRQSGGSHSLHIAIRRWSGRGTVDFNFLRSSGNAQFPHLPQLGPVELIQTRERLHAIEGERARTPSRLNGLVGIVGILSLLLFLERRDRIEYLWLGLAQTLGALIVVVTSLAVSFDLSKRSLVVSLLLLLLSAGQICVTMFLRELCPRLSWLLAGTAFLYATSGIYAAAVQWLNLPFASIAFAGPPALQLVAQLGTAGALIGSKERRGIALAASMMIMPVLMLLSSFGWRVNVSWSGYTTDMRDLASIPFAITSLAVMYLRYRDEQRQQQAREQELAAGQRAQQLLLESSADQGEGLIIEKAYLPASEVGGDFYQVLSGADGATLVIVGDVSGKGLRAAMMASLVCGAVRRDESGSPGIILEGVNRALAPHAGGGFVTCCCVRLERGGRMTIANAGHLAPYMDGRELATESGLPAGVISGAEYPETVLTLPLGVQLTLVSDGVVEAENAQRELFGFDRTREISKKSAQEIAATAKAWGQTDDITVVTVRRHS